MENHKVLPEVFNLSFIRSILQEDVCIILSETDIDRIERSHVIFQKKMEEGVPIYGVNTGFGALCNTLIDSSHLSMLQKNVVISHAQGMGEPLPESVSKLTLLYKVNTFRRGLSGVSRALVNHMIDMFNKGIFPVLYRWGSVGASGDLIPLAHLALGVCGEGMVWHRGKILKQLPGEILSPYSSLGGREGLALVNGTEFSSALLTHAVFEVEKFLKIAFFSAHLSLLAIKARKSPFAAEVVGAKPHPGQRKVGQIIRRLLELHQYEEANRTQDPYSFRCIPQIMGPLLDMLNQAIITLLREINGCSDNPIVANNGRVYSGGNFHAEYLAVVADSLKIPLIKALIAAERRIKHVLSGENGLPPFLANNPGLNSGFMAFHYLVASLLNEAISRGTPASITNIPTCNDQEDVVSMAPSAIYELLEIVERGKKILGVEALCALQAIFLGENIRLAHPIANICQVITGGKKLPFYDDSSLKDLSLELSGRVQEMETVILQFFEEESIHVLEEDSYYRDFIGEVN